MGKCRKLIKFAKESRVNHLVKEMNVIGEMKVEVKIATLMLKKAVAKQIPVKWDLAEGMIPICWIKGETLHRDYRHDLILMQWDQSVVWVTCDDNRLKKHRTHYTYNDQLAPFAVIQ